MDSSLGAAEDLIRRAHSLSEQHQKKTRLLIENRTLKRYVDYFSGIIEGGMDTSLVVLKPVKVWLYPGSFANSASLLNKGRYYPRIRCVRGS